MKQRLLTAALLTGCLILGILSGFILLGQDRKPPVIHIKKSDITYEEGSDYGLLLKGITAKDNRDGDVTKEIFVSRIVPMEGNQAIVYYGVMDKHKNVGSAFRIVSYIKGEKEPTDTSEEKQPVEVETSEQTQKDKTDSTENKVTPEEEAPVLTLNADNITIAAGTEFDTMSVIEQITDTKDDADTLFSQITVEGEYDINTPGDYSLSYYTTDSDGNTSQVQTLVLTVQ
jgi:hypothetical protein